METKEYKYEFDANFRMKIVAACLDNQWMAKYSAVIKPEYFELYEETAVVEAILEYREMYKISPPDDADLQAAALGKQEKLITKDRINSYIQAVFNAREEDLTYPQDAAIEFARNAAFWCYVLEIGDGFKKGMSSSDKIAAAEKLKATQMLGVDIDNLGILFNDPKSLLLLGDTARKTVTGWAGVDKILDGGLADGALGIILGPSGRGKSTALINIGCGIARYRKHSTVVHFSHEMSKEEVIKRYYARFVGQKLDRSNLDDCQKALEARLNEEGVGDIYIITGSHSTADIENSLEVLTAEGRKISVVIDDYLDLVTVPGRPVHEEERHKLSYLYRWYRMLGGRYGVPVWTASQSNRGSLNKEVVSMQDIAEDYGKAQIADVIIALCQTDNEEEKNECRLYMTKVRDGVSGKSIRAKINREEQSILTRESDR